MEGLRNIPGFLGTSGNLLVDIALIVEILFYVVLCLGVTAQLWRKYKWHDRLQIPVVLLNLFFIGLVMIPTFFAIIREGIGQIPGVVLIHAGLGILAELVAIYCLLAGLKILPRKIGVLRYYMWTAFVLWTLTVLFGVALYLSFYTGAAAQDEVVSEQVAELTGEHAAEVEVTATQPPAEIVTEHAEEPIVEQPTATPAEPVEEHDAEPVETVEEHAAEPTVEVAAEPAAPTTEPTPSPSPAPTRVGLLTISDAEVHGDKVTLALAGVTPPPNGSIYEAWLMGQGLQSFSAGKLTVTGDTINHTFTDPQGRNLLGLYNGAFISIEPANDNDPSSSGVVAYQGEVPATVIEPIRLVIGTSPDTPAADGPALRARNQLGKISAEIGFQQDYSIPNDDLAALKIQAEGIINVIEGKTGPNYGDADGNGEVYDQGDGFGLLGSGEDAGYLQAVIDQAVGVSQVQEASAETKLRAEQTQTAAKNAIGWLEQLRDLELQIIKASNIAAATPLVNNAVEIFNLVDDTNGSGMADPSQAGIQAMYNYAQLMGSIELFPAPSQPAAPAAEPTSVLIDDHAAESGSEHDGQ